MSKPRSDGRRKEKEDLAIPYMKKKKMKLAESSVNFQELKLA